MRITISEVRRIVREEIELAEAKKAKKDGKGETLGGMSQKSAKRMVSKLADDPGPTFSDIVDFAKGWQAEDPEAYAATLMRRAGVEPTQGPKTSGGKKVEKRSK
jgi:hypothetical protein